MNSYERLSNSCEMLSCSYLKDNICEYPQDYCRYNPPKEISEEDEGHMAIEFSVTKGLNMELAIGQAIWGLVKNKIGERIEVRFYIK